MLHIFLWSFLYQLTSMFIILYPSILSDLVTNFYHAVKAGCNICGFSNGPTPKTRCLDQCNVSAEGKPDISRTRPASCNGMGNFSGIFLTERK